MSEKRDRESKGEGWDAASQKPGEAGTAVHGGGGKSGGSPRDDGDDGLGPADEDEDEAGLPGGDVDETSAGGLMYPDDPSEPRKTVP